VTARPGQQICADRGIGLCTDSAPQLFEWRSVRNCASENLQTLFGVAGSRLKMRGLKMATEFWGMKRRNLNVKDRCDGLSRANYCPCLL